ncbi:MAG: nitrophenyl compound nitroreductase subunit ArsF family protein [Candidatus Hydrogenedens sp.]|nr:nitrophenyl compound nitroreductase subunit ArsF family protein [Candidatus Hydrogenedens sp.]
MKNIISALLILFVCVSLGYLVYSEVRNNRVIVSDVKKQVKEEVPQEDSTSSKDTATNSKINEKVIVYYFHGTARCPTCRAIEKYAKEAVENAFKTELETGKLEFRSVNVEEPQNEHFIQDFQLSTRCVVVEWNVNGKPQDWKRLERVWELVHGDKVKYYDYIQENVRQYLKG